MFTFQRVYDLVSAKLEEKGSQAVKLLPRLTKYFVHGKNDKNLGVCVPHVFIFLGHKRESDKKQILPRFPPEMWSCYSRVLESKPSTTNFLEGNHRGYDYKFMKDHPSFKDFVSILAKDIKAVEKDIGLVQENKKHLVQRKRRQERQRTADIKTSCELYKSDFTTEDLLDYLRNLAKITSRTTRFTDIDEEDE